MGNGQRLTVDLQEAAVRAALNPRLRHAVALHGNKRLSLFGNHGDCAVVDGILRFGRQQGKRAVRNKRLLRRGAGGGPVVQIPLVVLVEVKAQLVNSADVGKAVRQFAGLDDCQIIGANVQNRLDLCVVYKSVRNVLCHDADIAVYKALFLDGFAPALQIAQRVGSIGVPLPCW